MKADSKVEHRIFSNIVEKEVLSRTFIKRAFQVEVDVDAAEKLMVCRFADYTVFLFRLYK